VRPDPNSIRILAVDDHPRFREGIAARLATQPDMNLLAQACNGHEAIVEFRAHRPDITLMDLQMSGMNGLDAVNLQRVIVRCCRIIRLTPCWCGADSESEEKALTNSLAPKQTFNDAGQKSAWGKLRSISPSPCLDNSRTVDNTPGIVSSVPTCCTDYDYSPRTAFTSGTRLGAF
jgi:CheY-like chemotaxis protein